MGQGRAYAFVAQVKITVNYEIYISPLENSNLVSIYFRLTYISYTMKLLSKSVIPSYNLFAKF